MKASYLFLSAVLLAGCAAGAAQAGSESATGGPAASAAPAVCPGGFAASFGLGGEVTTPKRYTLADLQAMTASKLNVSYYSGKSGLVTESYIGVPLYDLLTAAGIVRTTSCARR